MRLHISLRRSLLALLYLLCSAWAPSRAQNSELSTTLSGIVSDPSGAKVFRAKVHLQGSHVDRNLTTDSTGRFTTEVQPGTYSVSVTFPGFEDFIRRNVKVTEAQPVELPIRLAIPPRIEDVFVPSDESSNPTDPAANLGTLKFSGTQLDLFSDDEKTMRDQLGAIVGSTGENGPQIFVDGFSGGRIPPKSSIREIRINQNPFSAQYDRQGFSRVDILTKPGTDKLHGFAQLTGNDNAFNARNPFVLAQPAYHTVTFEGNVTGPIGKKTSFFLSGLRLDQQSNSVINALGLSGTIVGAIQTPQTSNTISARLDHQFSPRNTMTGRYEYNGAFVTNGGILTLTLPSEAYNSSILTHTLQLGDTHIINPKAVSETRFQYIRTRARQDPVDSSPTIIVQGAFNGGGALNQVYVDNQDRYEFQENISLERGKHFIRTGFRYRALRDANLSTENYNGRYIFGGGTAPVLDGNNNPVRDANGNVQTETISALEQYRRATQHLPGGTASLYNLTQGQPNAVVLTGDIGAYAEDDWKLRKNLTLSFGVRLESQTAIPDHFDPAPRVSMSWAITHGKAKTPLVVLRPGFALFYDRFVPRNLLQAIRQNGVTQQAFYVQDAPYCDDANSSCMKKIGTLQSEPTVYRVDPNLRSQYDIIASITAEHSFGKHGNISVMFTPLRGVHQFVARNANAPLPGTYVSTRPTSGVRPLGGNQNLYQYSSNAYAKGSTTAVTGTWYPVKGTYVIGLYSMQTRDSDTGGAAAFTSNPYNVSADFGRSGTIAKHHLYLAFDSTLPGKIELATYLVAHSGKPYNITTGTDLNGDTIYNDRPSFTSSGGFNITPTPNQPVIPINYGNSPGLVALQLSLERVFHVGPKREGSGDNGKASAERPFEVGVAADSNNLLNHVNPGIPIGVLSSPLFGKSVSLAESTTNTNNAANRTINLRAYFRF